MSKARKKRNSKIDCKIADIKTDIAGENAQNLAKIAKETATRISKTSTGFLIEGGEYKKHTAAKNILTRTIEALEKGDAMTVELLNDLIKEELEGALPKDKNPPRDFSEIFNGAALELQKKTIEPRNEAQQKYMQAIANNIMTFGVGPAGTGKTFIAVAMAVAAYELNQVDKIILCRPAVEAGEKLGYLPGKAKDKVDPYFRPIYDTLEELMPNYKQLIANGTIEIAPLGFMRGRTLRDAFVVLDEAQNATTTQMRMLLTRLGENSRMVIDGDISQIDLPKELESGFIEALEALKDTDGVEINRFASGDVERHPLVSRMVADYSAYDERKKVEEAANPQPPSSPAPS
jgi:phosphate starvation-inducible PhoH-like protein